MRKSAKTKWTGFFLVLIEVTATSKLKIGAILTYKIYLNKATKVPFQLRSKLQKKKDNYRIKN